MADSSMSPVPKRQPVIEQSMSFFSALKEVLNGKKIHKLEWKDKENYGTLDGGRLRLHKSDGKLYDWIISDGDLTGNDWVLIG